MVSYSDYEYTAAFYQNYELFNDIQFVCVHMIYDILKSGTHFDEKTHINMTLVYKLTVKIFGFICQLHMQK